MQIRKEVLPKCLRFVHATASAEGARSPDELLLTANCQNCGNFLMLKSNASLRDSKRSGAAAVICQAIKDHPKLQFRPDFNLLSIIRSLKKYEGLPSGNNSEELSCANVKYNPQAKYLKYRRKTVRALFQTSERFGFNNETVHHAIALLDGALSERASIQVEGERVERDALEVLRAKFSSCKGVISEQICTFVASVSLFVSAKYLEIKYPVVEDVCQLMQCPFTFDEFVQMEAHILQDKFKWDLQIPTVIEALQTLLSQGALFTTDCVNEGSKEGSPAANEDAENEDPNRRDPYKRTTRLSEATKEQREALFSRLSKLCLSLLPNLLVYDAPLVLLAAQETSAVHQAVAIIIEARRSLGIWSEHACGYGSAGDVALMFMAFGDALLPKSSFEVNPQEKPTAKITPNYGQVFNDMIKEMEKVHGLVEKVQMSLYTKTYPYR